MTDFGTSTTAAGMTEASFMEGASQRQLSTGGAFVESFIQGARDSFGLGTAVRELSIPSGAPTQPLRDEQGIQLEDDAAFEARRAAAQPLTEEAYKASPSYRDKIPWDARMNEPRAKAMADWFDTHQYRDVELQRTNTFAVQTVGGLLGQATDPVNYIPVLGPGARAWAVGRFGQIAGRAAASSADAALNTAIFGAATMPTRESFGDDVSFRALMLDVGGAALIGAAFGGVHGYFAQRSSERIGASIRNAADVHRALDEAVGTLGTGGDVRLTRGAVDAVERARTSETATRHTLPDIEARMGAELSAFHNGPDFYTDGANPRSDFQRLMETVPEEIRDKYMAHGIDATRGGTRTEALDGILRERPDSLNAGPLAPTSEERSTGVLSTRSDAPYLLIYDKERPVSDGPAAVVVNSRDRGIVDAVRAAYPDERVMSPEEAATALRNGEKLEAPQSRPKSNLSVPRDPLAPPELAAAASRVEQRMTPEQREAPTEGPSRSARELAEDFKVDPTTGDFPEMADFERLEFTERLTGDERKAFDEATQLFERSKAYADGLRAAAICMMV